MKKVGAYATLFKNSLAKTTWKNYGFDEAHEQVNLMFSVLLYIMECSLKKTFVRWMILQTSLIN